MALIVDTCVARHPGDRSEQQDRAGVFAHPSRAGTLIAVLADGMGGLSGGAFAAEQVVAHAKRNFDAFEPGVEDARVLLEGIVSEAHLLIRLARYTTETEPHSTAVALVLQPDRVSWIHCGDSRVYHFRSSRVVSRSEDHSLVAELQRRGRIDAAAALRHPRRNVLLTCLGSDRAPGYSVAAPVRPLAGDCFLLCSDGLWPYFSDDELACVVSSRTAREAAEALIDGARARACGAGDNISLVVIKLRAAPCAGATASVTA